VQVWNLETFEREKMIVTHDHPFGTLVTARGMLFGGSLKVIKVPVWASISNISMLHFDFFSSRQPPDEISMHLLHILL